MEDKDLSIFCMQLALILKSGIVLHEGISMMREDAQPGVVKNKLMVLEEVLIAGKTLDVALETEGSFPAYMVDMVRVGTKSGRLEEVVRGLWEYYEREVYLNQSIKSAVFYPLILSTMMLGVMLILSIKVLPIFQEVFNSLGGEISGFAKGFMEFGRIMGEYVYGVIATVIAVTLSVKLIFKAPKGRSMTQRLMSRLKITEKIAKTRFLAAMALMMASGIETEEALKLASKFIENKKLKLKIEHCEIKIQEGSSFVNALSQTEMFPKLTIRMLSIGMKTGNIDEVMKQVADH
ncbi:MAG: gspF [Clostridia bacterium]|nr:gspF [Clostridia bacterium]